MGDQMTLATIRLTRQLCMWTLAALLAAFHVVMVSLPVLTSRGSGEGQAFMVMIFDFPLVWFVKATLGPGVLYGNSQELYIFIFSVVGALMYAAVGASIGFVVDQIRLATR